MPVSFPEKRKFILDLCAEHLDEIAFLHAQRRYILSDRSTAAWPDAHRFETRLHAHLDALALEGTAAAAVCRRRRESSDPGDLYGAMRFFIRRRPAQARRLLERVPPARTAKIDALGDALADEAPFHGGRVLDILRACPSQVRLAARVAGDARMASAWPLVAGVNGDDPAALAQVLRLAGRIGRVDADRMLLSALYHTDGAVHSAACVALLRLGVDIDVLCRTPGAWPVALGLGGAAAEAERLMDLARRYPADRDPVIGLGLLGELSAVPMLIDMLDAGRTPAAAALALRLITGADLPETVLAVEPIDRNELFSHEREALDHGGPAGPGGAASGRPVTRLSQDPEDWRGWVGRHRRHFVPGTRYRNGRPCSPACLVENMRSTTLPAWLRQLAHEEMVIRYGMDFPFDADGPVWRQLWAVDRYAEWAETADTAAGHWYFAGRLRN